VSERRYQVCGTVIETSWPLTTRLVDTHSPAELSFRVSDHPPADEVQTRHEIDYGTGRVTMALARAGPHEVLRFPDIGDAFLLGDDRIVLHLQRPEHAAYVEPLLLGMILATWLERRGRVTLHGSAVAFDGQAVGLLGPGGTGKSNMALALAERGAEWLTDDLLAVAVDPPEVLPSFPQARLWSEDAIRRLGTTDGLAPARAGSPKLGIPIQGFAPQSRQLHALYLPRRDPAASQMSFSKIEGPRALVTLLALGFARGFVDVAEHRAGWVERMGRLTSRVPVFEFVHPDRHDSVAETAAAIEQHNRSV